MAPPASDDAAAAAPARQRDFAKGLAAHLVLVPPWIAAPIMLFGGLVTAGAPHGLKGVVATLGIGVGMIQSSNMVHRLPLIIAVIGVGAASPPDRRVLATVAAGVVSLLAWMCKGGKKDAKQRPGLWNFLSTYRADFYEKAELRGDLETLKKENSCFAFHPHGCLCAGFTINGCYNPDFMRSAGRVNWLCDSNLRYKNPFFRMVCDMTKGDDHCVESADKKTFQKLMAKGENVAFLPGGFQDAVAYGYGKEATVIKRRKGFIKYCLQYGYRVHPVYTFGESETYYAFTALRKLRMAISEQNIPMAAFFGWPLMPCLPRPQSRIITYVGPPLELPKVPEPSAAEVDKWHGEYIKALTKLFNDKRAEAGWPEAALEIL